MKQVWKFKLNPGLNYLNMPEDAEILTVQVQYGHPCLWAIVDPKATPTARVFETFGTGWDLSEDEHERRYLGTVQLNGGSLIFHVFERIEKQP